MSDSASKNLDKKCQLAFHFSKIDSNNLNLKDFIFHTGYFMPFLSGCFLTNP